MGNYEGLMFPKTPKKKKRKHHKKSILHRKEDRTCYLCMLLDNNFNRHNYLEEHHIFHGRPNRQHSEEEGLKVYLCDCHHKDGPKAVHNNAEIDQMLKEIAQKEYEKTHTREQFRAKFGKSAL